MKKFLLLLTLFLFAKTMSLCASGDAVLKVQSLIDGGFFKNKSQISELSGSLTSDEKSRLIEDNKIDATFPMYMNGALGYGIGSFLAKDYIGGAVHCAIDVTCNVVMIAMFSVYMKSVLKPFSDKSFSGNDADSIVKNMKNYLYAGIATTVVLLINRIAQLVSLTVHVNKYNRTLSQVLAGGTDKKVAVNVFPILDDKKFGLGVSFDIPNRS